MSQKSKAQQSAAASRPEPNYDYTQEAHKAAELLASVNELHDQWCACDPFSQADADAVRGLTTASLNYFHQLYRLSVITHDELRKRSH